MSKEMFIASSPHETKVAVCEDDQLVEVYFERDTDVGLVGGIYKGRVKRVLPGMQSAFVDIGLERDAFLYVSDFFEDAEEYDKLVTEAEARVTRYTESASAPVPLAPPALPPHPAAPSENPPAESSAGMPPQTTEPSPSSDAPAEATNAQPAPAQPPSPAETATASSPPSSSGTPAQGRPTWGSGEYRQRGRRRHRRGRGFGEQKFYPKREFRDRPAQPPTTEEAHPFEILPGESLAKYRNAAAPTPPAETPALGVSEPSGAAPASDESALAKNDAHQENAFAPTDPLAPQVESSPAPLENIPERENEREVHEDESAQLDGVAPPETSPEAAQASPAMAPKPRPLWNRLISTVFGAESESTEQEEATAETRQSPEPSASTSPLSALEASETARDYEAPAGHEGALQAPETPTPLPADSTAPSLPAPRPAPGAELPEREYTLRERHQRPHFAPRRGPRGRHGRGRAAPRGESAAGPRPEAYRSGNTPSVQIADLLKEGQEILVQIAKEPLGRKGARITSHIALPGRYLVYMPTVDHIGVSRKIASEEERLRLRNVILENRGALTGGFIVRTAAQGRSEEELKADIRFLSTLWNEIRAKAETTKAPALLYRDLDLVQRILRDILSPDFKSIRVDNEIEYERVLDFVNRCQPSLVGHVKLYTRDTPLFEEFGGVQEEIDKALKSKVWLKSGGYIVINQTEALVAIDVNTGKYVGKTNRLEDTIVKTNIDAIQEIVRQIRLRDLGGIIVIDFIDMDERRNRQKVVQALEEALRRDRAPTKILNFNDFGLVALTRKRVKQSLERTLCVPCAYCSGSGWIKSVNTVCYEILAEVRKMASQIEGDALTLRVNPEVARALKSREGTLISEIESISHKDVIIKSDPAVHQERFEIY